EGRDLSRRRVALKAIQVWQRLDRLLGVDGRESTAPAMLDDERLIMLAGIARRVGAGVELFRLEHEDAFDDAPGDESIDVVFPGGVHGELEIHAVAEQALLPARHVVDAGVAGVRVPVADRDRSLQLELDGAVS